ncbi:hypothetical protein GLAREA_07981 [Glarea lozoyensis ATCC 20868]|uniref:Uncharacterized protein n=1 Tax=Glarea lozoyensis (strain ATCC 20868 / MF5171) TaxID=1116229 RepID=S3CWD5_GLAL2|nr:uncharacterized protein GLAREA_07981 [Glarea lozoyensis ATCC 20868]EPE24131.1 hypothetical protein GLAREA_07981 [Glarea lozoyensis ATCC 20868]
MMVPGVSLPHVTDEPTHSPIRQTDPSSYQLHPPRQQRNFPFVSHRTGYLGANISSTSHQQTLLLPAKTSLPRIANLLSSISIDATLPAATTTMAKISGIGAFFIIVLFVVLLGTAAWIIYTHLRARRLGLPTPTLASYNPFVSSGRSSGGGGVVGWVKDKIGGLKNRNNRSAGGAYEEPLSSNVRGRASNRGFGPLDPDDAWDARVGTEADAYGPGGYYEEQELGLHGEQRGGLGASGYNARGRSLSREPEPYIGGSQGGLDRRYDEEMGRKPAVNPFDDSAAVGGGLRGVSPRPIEMDATGGNAKGKGSLEENSPTERRSMFRENM